MIALALAVVAGCAGLLVHAAPQARLETRDGVLHNLVQDADLGLSMDYVANSGICETTPGVKQYSGYLSPAPGLNYFFWFFEARHSPETAPLSTWFNGGPGCSSLIGLMQENGPCHFPNNQSEPALNPYSFNEYANMLYIDQPVGVGFSYGVDPVVSTVTAAPFVWKVLQLFYKQFPQYKSRDFGIFTESYGGHYGPEFASFITQQNQAIDKGLLPNAQKISLTALGINNGWFDAITQYKAFIDFSVDNKYNKIIDEQKAASYYQKYNNVCKPTLQTCRDKYDPAESPTCAGAQVACLETIENAIANEKDFDVYDVRQPRADPYPPTAYLDYLNRPEVQKAIGARQGDFAYCSTEAGVGFIATGDNSRSFLPTLSDLVSGGLRTLIWSGDADWICNYKGNFDVVQQVTFPGATTFRTTALKPYTVNGKEGGLYKTKDNLSWLQVYGAGHEVPYYQPELSLQAFKQTMMKQAITST